MANGADLAVTRRLSGASQRSRMSLLSWGACSQSYHAVQQQQLAPPSGALQFDAQRDLHCCYLDCFAAAGIGLVAAGVVTVVVDSGSSLRARHAVGSGRHQQAQVGSRLGFRAVAIGG